MSKKLSLKVGKTPDPALAANNIVYLNSSDARSLRCRDQEQYVEVGRAVYIFKAHKEVPQGTVALNMLQRNFGSFALGDPVPVENYILGRKERNFYLSSATFTCQTTPPDLQVSIDLERLSAAFLKEYHDHFVSLGQSLVLEHPPGQRLLLFTESCAAIDMAAALGQGEPQSAAVSRGLLMETTQLLFRPAPNTGLRFVGQGGSSTSASHGPALMGRRGPISADWSFESMGIGGLDKEFSQIFRRAFASRLFPPAVIQKLGIRHTRGILLYGPPGTGKTLLARQIGKMLGGKVPPKLVMGPEILNKFVGQSEENIRNLFADAEKEYKARGEESDLHVIIFDEIDAICKARGSTSGGTGVADTVVNQLLSKIDGVESLNNILVIGMTNRKDMIDEALLRPGRLEVHMEIGLPNEEGRLQIFRIHTEKMRSNNMLGADVDLAELAALGKNYTGAEIEGVVDSAASFALNREVDMDNLSKELTGDNMVINRADFLRAFQETPPAFGVDQSEFDGCALNGIIDFGPSFAKINQTCVQFINQVLKSDRTPIISVLLHGEPGCGKTSLAAMLAQRSGFPFSKLLSPEKLIGMSDQGKMEKIRRMFEDAYKSPHSVIVADDVERLLNFAPMGPIFSNQLLQTLFVTFKRAPPGGRKMIIFATTSSLKVLTALGIADVFSHILKVPNVETPAEAAAVLRTLGGWSDADATAAARVVGEIPIKKLISISEMAQQATADPRPLIVRFENCLENNGIGSKAFQSRQQTIFSTDMPKYSPEFNSSSFSMPSSSSNSFMNPSMNPFGEPNS